MSNLTENYGTIVKLFDELQVEYVKATENGNKSAARRTRVAASKLMKLLKELRKNITDELYNKED